MAYSLTNSHRIVIKVGSALITDTSSGELRHAWLTTLAEDIKALTEQGKEVLVVTSGAVALGRKYLKIHGRPFTLEEKQAAFTCGQIALIEAWKQSLARQDLTTAQVLITPYDTENRRRYLNARNTLDTLLANNIVPVLNENDAVSTQELRFGDNDRLSARIAQMAGADLLILLSDIDGLYTADPRTNPDATFLPEVRSITPEILAMGGKSGTNVGSGGMYTKLLAAQIAVGAGCHMVIMQGHDPYPLKRLAGNTPCTWFLASENPVSARKHWIASNLHPQGEITVDAGAARALSTGNSLLPIGVKRITGSFDRGDAVLVKDESGTILARGLSAYAAVDAHRIVGKRSDEIAALLGYQGRAELIHRDDLVLE